MELEIQRAYLLRGTRAARPHNRRTTKLRAVAERSRGADGPTGKAANAASHRRPSDRKSESESPESSEACRMTGGSLPNPARPALGARPAMTAAVPRANERPTLVAGGAQRIEGNRQPGRTGEAVVTHEAYCGMNESSEAAQQAKGEGLLWEGGGMRSGPFLVRNAEWRRERNGAADTGSSTPPPRPLPFSPGRGRAGTVAG
jgi:hypothetical protein